MACASPPVEQRDIIAEQRRKINPKVNLKGQYSNYRYFLFEQEAEKEIAKNYDRE